MGAFDMLSDDDPRVIYHEQKKQCSGCDLQRTKKNALYCIEFKEKGDKRVYSVLIVAENEEKACIHFNEKYVSGYEGHDIDKRTIKWGGSSLPLANQDKDGVISFVHWGKIED
jgi:hypothetical protein